MVSDYHGKKPARAPSAFIKPASMPELLPADSSPGRLPNSTDGGGLYRLRESRGAARFRVNQIPPRAKTRPVRHRTERAGGRIIESRRIRPTAPTTPTVLCLVGAFMCSNFVAVALLTWMPKFLYDRFHMGLAVAGLTPPSSSSWPAFSAPSPALAGRPSPRPHRSGAHPGASRWSPLRRPVCSLVRIDAFGAGSDYSSDLPGLCQRNV
jgi:hypothetical protein